MGKFFAGLFGLPLALLSLVAGLAGVYGVCAEAIGWYERRSWQPVMVEVVDATLVEENRHGYSSYSGRAAFRFVMNNQEYNSTVVDHTRRNDSLEDWQIAIYEELVDARRKNRRVVAFADPANPSHVMIERGVDWVMVVTGIGFGFGLIACAAWIPWRIFRRKP